MLSCQVTMMPIEFSVSVFNFCLQDVSHINVGISRFPKENLMELVLHNAFGST
jgi:hypothetical protein